MKKSVHKLLSAALALVLLLSAMPLAAFAAEEHEHTGDCCSNVSPAAAVICNHIYYTNETATYEYCDNDYHWSTVSVTQTCALCGFSVKTSETVAKHGHTPDTLTLISGTNNLYEGECMYCKTRITVYLPNGLS